jgi:uncharacterized membrane protein YfcA
VNEALLVPLAFLVGVYGTITGAGGGFILVPLLLFLYPDADPASITSISLGVVFCNSLSGSWAYARAGRIDFRSGWVFSATSVPGAVLGALAVGFVARGVFDGVFGLLIVGLGLFLILRPQAEKTEAVVPRPGMIQRTITDAHGNRYTYAYYLWQGTLLSAVAGFFSSLLGIGGGFIKVPVMVFLLNFPAHIATATSQFTLVVMALAGTAVHLVNRDLGLESGLTQMFLLVLGVIPGAQVGALVSRRLHASFIIRLLGASLVLIGGLLLARVLA